MLSNWVGSGAFWVNSSQLGDGPVWSMGAEGFTIERMASAREIRQGEAGYQQYAVMQALWPDKS